MSNIVSFNGNDNDQTWNSNNNNDDEDVVHGGGGEVQPDVWRRSANPRYMDWYNPSHVRSGRRSKVVADDDAVDQQLPGGVETGESSPRAFGNSHDDDESGN